MTDHACIVCAKADTADGLTVCAACLDRTSRRLLDILTLTRQAGDHLIRNRTATTPSGPRTPSSNPPLSNDAHDDYLALDVIPPLESWERRWRQHAGHARYGIASAHRTSQGIDLLAGIVDYLRSQVPRMCEDPTWPIEDLHRVLGNITAALRRWDSQHTGKPAGVPVPCPSPHPDEDGTECGWELRTHDDDVIVCPQCLTHWLTADILDTHAEQPYPASVLIVLDDQPGDARRRLSNWRARGKIQPAAYADTPNGGRPTPLYRLGEYRTLLAAVNRLDNIVIHRPS